jgi:hypothetical protein
MGKTKLGHDLAASVDYNDVMMLLRPVKTGKVSYKGIRRRHCAFPFGGLGAVSRSISLGLSPEST